MEKTGPVRCESDYFVLPNVDVSVPQLVWAQHTQFMYIDVWMYSKYRGEGGILRRCCSCTLVLQLRNCFNVNSWCLKCLSCSLPPTCGKVNRNGTAYTFVMPGWCELCTMFLLTWIPIVFAAYIQYIIQLEFVFVLVWQLHFAVSV